MTRQAELDPAAGDVPRDRHLRQACPVLGDEPLPHPSGGVTLLPRHLLVPDEPVVDDPNPRVERRPRPARVHLRRGGTGEAKAWRTARRCTPCRRAS